jgi:hypothetical protein
VAVTLVQSNIVPVGSNASPQTATFTSSTTSGNLLMAFVRQQVNSTSALSDNKGNTWTLKTTYASYSGSWNLYIYYCNNAIGGASHTVSATESGTGWNVDIELMEFSGADPSNPFDVNPTGPLAITSNASSSSPTNGQAITTIKPNDYVIGIFDAKTTTTYSQATGWTLINTANNGVSVGYVGALVAAAGSSTPQILSAITSWGQIAFSLAIASAPAGGGSAVPIYRNPLTGPMAMRYANRAKPQFVAASQFVNTQKALTAGVSFTGAFTARNIFTKLLTGALSFTGNFVKIPRKLFTGVLSMTGGQTGSQVPTLVQVGTISTTSDAASNTLTFPSNITAGNMIVVNVIETGNGTIAGVSDATGAYTQIGSPLVYQGVTKMLGFYGLNRGGGFNTISVAISTFTGSGLYVVAEEWSGVASYEGQTGQVQAGTTNLDSGNYITTGAPDLLIGMFGVPAGNVITASGGYSNLNNAGATSYMESQNVLSTGTYSATATQPSASGVGSALAAFRAGSITIPALKIFTNKIMTASTGFTGAFIKATRRSMTAGLSFVGTWASGGHFAYIISLVAASVGFTGNMNKKTGNTQPAGLTFTGAQTKQTRTTRTAGLSFTGAFTAFRRIFSSLTATLSFTGAFKKQTGKTHVAGLSFTGLFSRFTKRLFTAGLSFTGVFAKGAILYRALTASLGFIGNYTKQARKPFAGSVGFTGAFKFGGLFFRTLTAGLSFTGVTNMPKAIKKGVAAGLSFTGVFSRGGIFYRNFTAGLSFVGSTTKRAQRTFTAGLSFAGAWVYHSAFFRNFTASVGFTGTFRKQSYKSLAAGLTFTGKLLKSTFEMFFTASLGFTGAIQRNIKTSFVSSLSFIGTFVGYIKPHFVALGAIISSFTNASSESSSSNIADVAGGGTISDVNTPDRQGNVNTGDTSSQLSSDTNKETLEG